MFDYHAHRGLLTDKAYVCTSSPLEAPLIREYKYKACGLLPGERGRVEEIEEWVKEGYGVGEIGLDKRFGDLNTQIDNFKSSLLIAKHYSVPVTIHAVGHIDIVLSLLKEIKPPLFIFHSFHSSLQVAREIERMGGYISLSPNAVKTKHFLSLIKDTSFLIETDMPTGKEEEEKLNELYNYISTILNRELTFPSIL